MKKLIAKTLVVLMTIQSISTLAFAEDKPLEKEQFKMSSTTVNVSKNVKEIQKNNNFIKREGDYRSTTLEQRAVSSIVNIPDVNLKNAIMTKLSLSSDESITIEKLSSLKELTLYSELVKDLEGIQYCTNLETLSLRECKINDISKISNLKNLKTLNLEYNSISDITPLEGLSKLQNLYLSGCNVSNSLDSTWKLTSLKKLTLSECHITDITPICKLVNLESLNLENNNIRKITGMESLKNLKELNLAYNSIMDFSSLATLNIETIRTDTQIVRNIALPFNGNKAVIENPLKNIDGSYIKITTNKYVVYNSNNTITFKSNNSNSYYIEYVDSSGNLARVDFIPEYTDKIEDGPEIILSNPLTILEGEEIDYLNGMKAFDEKDGDISKKISVNWDDVNIYTQGTYSITYSVMDSDNNTTTLTRTIFVEAYSYPTICNVEPVTIAKGDYFNPVAGIQVYSIDGMVSDRVTIEKNGYVNSNTPGYYTFTYSYTDRLGGKTSIDREITILEKAVTVIALEGVNRYETAAKLSSFIYEYTEAVVIVNGEAMADGLCVTPLAAAINAPILLTEKDVLPKSTIDEIKRLGATYVLIAGGEGVVSPKVVSQLKKLGITQIDRVGGANRYETSYYIANVIDQAVTDVSEVVIANGYGEADALSISSAAAYNMMPIILVEKDGIYNYTYHWMEGEALQNAYIIGGTGVVENGVLDMVNELTSFDINNNRLGGANRYDTNAAVIERFYKNADNSMKVVFISKGEVLVDALASGAVACLYNAPVVLTAEDLSASQVKVITPYRGFYIVRAGGGIPNKAVETLTKCLK